MSINTSVTNSIKHISTCPHGMPLGACPICNGISGGNSTTRRNIPRNQGELTYNQCLEIGAMLKAQKHNKEISKALKIENLNLIKVLLNKLIYIINNLNIKNDKLLKFLSIDISKITSDFISRLYTLVKEYISNSVSILGKNIINFKNILIDISDKLSAIYGELKLKLKEQISKFKRRLKRNIKFFFLIFNIDKLNSNLSLEKLKEIFDIKILLKNLLKKRTERINNESNKPK